MTSSSAPTRMLMAAAASAAGFVVLLLLAYFVGPARWIDAAALHGFISVAEDHQRVATTAHDIARVCDVLPYCGIALAVIAAAFATRGPRTGAAITLLLVGANVSSQTLKPLLAHHRETYYTHWHLNNLADASLPSGHATAAMAISLAILMTVPPAYRLLTAAAGAAFTIAVSFSLVGLGWHFPSDVVCGFLAATTWALAIQAGLTYANERWPDHGTMRTRARDAIGPPSPAVIVFTVMLLGAIALGLALSRAEQLAHFADRHTAAAAVASAIAVAATVLLAAVAALSSRRSSR